MNELQALHEAMTKTIRAGLPDKVRVDAFPDLEKGFNLPAVFFGMTDFVPGTENGTGMTPIKGRFQAVVLVDPVLPFASLSAMWLGMQLASLLHFQYWGLDFVNRVEDVIGEADNTNPALAAFEVWSVQWTQEFWIGDINAWPFPEIEPVQVVYDPDPDVVEVSGVMP